MTETLPTNKKGEVYYGATTLREAIEKADDMDAKQTLQYADELRSHGYTWIAARMLAAFGGRKELEDIAKDKE